MKQAPIVHLHLDITNNCNFRCEFCFHFGDLTARRGFMDTGLAFRVIDEVVDKGLASQVSTAVFGEALLHPEFFKIAEHAVKRGLRLTLNTKGGALDSEVARRICDTGIHKLIISFNTPDAETYAINHAPGKLSYAEHVEKLRQTLDQKAATGSPIQIYIYIMNTHFARPRGLKLVSGQPQAERVVGFWRDLAAGVAAQHGLSEPPATASLTAGELVTRRWLIDRGLELMPGVELVFKEGHMWANRMLDPALEPVPTETGYCPLPWTMLTVHWDGDCSLCCLDYNKDAVLGNVNDSSLETIFGGERMQRIRAGFSSGRVLEPLCQTCLGGVREKASGKLLRRPQSSGTARVLNGVEKYGIYQSLQYAWDRLRGRLGTSSS